MTYDGQRSCSPWTAWVARKHPHCPRSNSGPRLGMRECELVEGEDRYFSYNTINFTLKEPRKEVLYALFWGFLGSRLSFAN